MRAHRLLVGACVAAIVLGATLRLLSVTQMELWQDGHRYAALGRSLAEGQGMTYPWGGGLWTRPEPSHHEPPLWPAYLAGWYALLGFSALTTKLAALAASLAALGACAWVARDLLGEEAALLTAAVLALDPHLLWVTGTGFSENLVLLLFALTLWAIVRSLEEPWWMLAAAACAGLAYLTRASAGGVFVAMGIAGLAWRWHYRRWGVLRDVPYLLAVALFAAMVLAWALRNVHHFGWAGWETSAYLGGIQRCVLADVLGSCALAGGDAWGRFLLALLAKAPLFGLFLLLWLLPLWPEARASLRRVREERESALWLAVLLVLATGWVVAALFWAQEDTHLWWPENRRYAVLAAVPLLLAVGRHARWPERGLALRAGALLAVLAVLSAAALALPARFPENAAAASLDVPPGTTVAAAGGVTKYAFTASLPPTVTTVCTWPAHLLGDPACAPTVVLTDDPATVPCLAAHGFALASTHTQAYLLPGWPPKRVDVWVRPAAAPPQPGACPPGA